jgi:hypothetical protein
VCGNQDRCGDPGPAAHLEGTTWTIPPAAPGACLSFTSIKAFAPDDVWAASANVDPAARTRVTNPLAAHFDGRQWTMSPLAGFGDLA